MLLLYFLLRFFLLIRRQDQLFNDTPNRFQLEGLANKTVPTRFNCLFLIFRQGVRRQKDNLGVNGPSGNDRGGLQTIHNGHLHVHKYNIIHLVIRSFHSQFTIFNNINFFNSHSYQCSFQNLLVNLVVLGYQDFYKCHGILWLLLLFGSSFFRFFGLGGGLTATIIGLHLVLSGAYFFYYWILFRDCHGGFVVLFFWNDR
mmetsp:Transcript_13864/g.33545  ORF Transcript_13864/g.33545 Transcript_13864/m.33545 type:complete len:200 (-) Transcript_13864:2539-3138(-)